MKLPLPAITLTPPWPRRVAIGLLVVAGLMTVDVIYQVGMHVSWRRWIGRQAQAMAATTQPSTQPAKDKSGKPPELVAALRKRNFFQPPRPTGHGLSLTGVLGNIAFFTGRDGRTMSIKEGESGGGIKLKTIRDYEVVIEYKGKPETMKLFTGGPMPGAAPSMESAPVAVAVPAGGPKGSASSPSMSSRPEGMRIEMKGDLSNLPPEVRAQIEAKIRAQSE